MHFNFIYKIPFIIIQYQERNTRISGIITCSTRNIIYLLKCLSGLVCVGKTIRGIKGQASRIEAPSRSGSVQPSCSALYRGKLSPHSGSVLALNMSEFQEELNKQPAQPVTLQRSIYIFTFQTLDHRSLNQCEIKHFL